MKAYQLGQDQAFDALFERYETRFHSFFERRLHDKDLTEDLFQLLWMKIHEYRLSFDATRKFSSWAFTIAYNILRDEIGGAYKKMEMVELDTNMNDPDQVEADTHAWRSQIRAELEVSLNQLPPAQKEAILLSHIEGFSDREIAEVLRSSEGSVRQLLFRARKALRLQFQERIGSHG